MIRTYRKYIAENRNLVYVSTFLVVLLRTGFLFTTGYQLDDNNDIALAAGFPFLFENRYIPFICSLALTIFIALQLTYLDHKYTLIRGKTFLPYVFALFLLSLSPGCIYRILSYAGIIVILLGVHTLFSAYHQPQASRKAFGVGFTLGVAGLVFPGLLWYLIIFWIGFWMMRSFSFKAFLASLLAIAMFYWLKLFYIIYTQGFDNLMENLTRGWEHLYVPGIFPEVKLESVISIAIYALIVLIAVFDNYIRKFEDKIRIRTNFSFLNQLLLFSVVLCLFLYYYMPMNLIIALVISGFILSHFFALANKKWKVYFFILLVIFYFTNYVWTLMALMPFS